jgi:predicted CopG family antitoxin
MHRKTKTGLATIRLDQGAYDRLKAVRREGESFSQVIKRVIQRPVDVQQFLKRVGEHPLSEEAAAAIESQVKRRHCSSRGKR